MDTQVAVMEHSFGSQHSDPAPAPEPLNSAATSHLPKHCRSALLRRIESEPARVETDSRGRIIATNPAFSALCGYSFSEIRGRKPGSFLQGEKTETSEILKIREALRRREPVQAVMTNYHKDGSIYRVHISIEPVFNAAGRLKGFRATERKL